MRPFKKLSCFRPLRGRLVGVCDTPLQPGTCGPSKYRYDPLNGYVWPFKKLSRFHPLRGRGVGRIRYAPTIGYVCPFEIPIRSPDRVRARIQKMDLYTPPSVAYGGAYSIRPYNRVRTILRNTDVIPRPGMCGPSKNCPVFVPFGAVCGAYSIRPYNRVRIFLRKTVSSLSPSSPRCEAYSIRPYNWIRVTLRNTDVIPQPGTCEGSKNGSVFVPFGAVGWAYAIRPYNWVRAILRNTDAIFQLNTCGPSKNCPVFVPLRGRGVGVFDTPLQLGTCEGSKNGSVYATVGGIWWGVCDTPLQLGTCNPTKYRYDLSTGGAGAFGMWGGGGYRLRGRRA